VAVAETVVVEVTVAVVATVVSTVSTGGAAQEILNRLGAKRAYSKHP
jgi:hypothetical protein